MSDAAERIKEEILLLEPRDRAELAHLLISSLDEDEDTDAEAAWDAELAARVADVESGKALGEPADIVFARIREKYS
jgi:putative addiction module component (TIGR02574 family)